jgi:hypothetical protein
MNYATLSSTIQAYVENDFPASVGSGSLTSAQQIATFVTQAEQRIYNTVQLLALRKVTTLTTVNGTSTVSAPADWLATYSMAALDPVTGQYSFMANKDVEYIREAFPAPDTTGVPRYYALQDNDTFLLGPTPGAAYTLSLNYFYEPESITTANNTWLGDNFDSVLLYGSLLEAYTFMKGEADVIAGYQRRYDEAMVQLKQLAEGKNRQDTYRSLQVRYPVK